MHLNHSLAQVFLTVISMKKKSAFLPHSSLPLSIPTPPASV